MTQCTPWRVVAPLLSPADPHTGCLANLVLVKDSRSAIWLRSESRSRTGGTETCLLHPPPYLDNLNSSKLDVHHLNPKTSAINSQIKGYTQIKEYIQENASSWFALQTSQYV